MYLLMLLVIVILVMLVSLLFFYISYKKLLEFEMSSSYECGFNLISMARMFFSFRFFLITILFLIFDVEIALMLPIPYLISSTFISLVFYFFVVVLVIGLIYEFYYGSLEWLNFISKA
uniref:NADH-ubiquinone oxidoreductase chain 3 n=1 Tax=Cyclosa argenteoalba TaxID=345692 RepID=A0A0K0NTV4_9ARAC|nr:NADH dehydrogenase subunit 3 [Cyclosa argenteoalba]AKN58354.1 NADH dehydrogenase subunit 3 [Cyclosa argenteoalba]